MGRSGRWRETSRLVLTRQEVGSLGVSRKLESCQFPEPLALAQLCHIASRIQARNE